jgi:recombination protein RecA
MASKKASAKVSGDKKLPTTALEVMEAVRELRGNDSIAQLTGAKIAKVPVISTGLPSLDAALGIGGLPKGRIVEIAGEEAVGKSTLALHVVAEAQRLGGICAYVDAEHSLDPAYARALGVDTESLLFSQPTTGEDALNTAADLVGTRAVAVVVIDSVAALTPKAELEGEIGDSHMGLQARMMGQALRNLVGAANRTGTLVIFINQFRSKIGVMYGSPRTTTGGNALKFFASVRMELGRRGAIKVGDTPIGTLINIKVNKNKHAPPFKETEIDVIWGQGFDRYSDLLGMAITVGVVEKASGARFVFGGEQFAHGAAQAAAKLREDPKFYAELKKLVAAKGAA